MCREIKEKEKVVNLLFMSAGVIDLSKTRELSSSQGSGLRLKYKLLMKWKGTDEKLDLTLALTIYSRTRFIVNLLPLLKAAEGLRRVVTVFAGTKEGPLLKDDLGCADVSLLNIRNIRGHMCSMIDLILEEIAREAPGVSFIHDYPGFVDTGIFDKTEGVLAKVLRGWGKVTDVLVRSKKERYIPIEECGERHLFLATSARFEPADGGECGVPCDERARGSRGEVGGGVYVVDENLESAGTDVELLLKGMRRDGMGELVWKHVQDEFERIAKLNGDRNA